MPHREPNLAVAGKELSSRLYRLSSSADDWDFRLCSARADTFRPFLRVENRWLRRLLQRGCRDVTTTWEGTELRTGGAPAGAASQPPAEGIRDRRFMHARRPAERRQHRAAMPLPPDSPYSSTPIPNPARQGGECRCRAKPTALAGATDVHPSGRRGRRADRLACLRR